MSSTLPGQDRLSEILPALEPWFSDKISYLLEQLIAEGVVIRPYSGRRGALEQAVLWVQSRTPLEVELMARRLEEEHAPFLASSLRRALAMRAAGRWATNNLPGQSWHNFGLAIDAHVVSEDGRAVWGPKHDSYRRYAEVARELGLWAGHDMPRQDVVHVQAHADTVRNKIGPWAVVDKVLVVAFERS